ncbi:hypothetical protein C2S51_006849 [Perilla frutescens var. frutescens]|nr:hypothetical protein C2S51_006849 [Perilla frutescens var. frutescens]
MHCVTEKCDVYSFGVVALEIMFGDHAGDFLSSMIISTQFAQNMMLQHLLHKRLPSPDEDIRVSREVVHVVTTALKCINSEPKSQPSMKEVSEELGTANALSPHINAATHLFRLSILLP